MGFNSGFKGLKERKEEGEK